MSGRAFADTNILIYAASDPADPAKSEQARVALSVTHVISVQVLNEFVNVTRKKLRQDWTAVNAALNAIEATGIEILPLTYDLHLAARQISQVHHLRIYDASIVAAALEAGCETLWSEDLQAGRTFGGLTVRNPFEDL